MQKESPACQSEEKEARSASADEKRVYDEQRMYKNRQSAKTSRVRKEVLRVAMETELLSWRQFYDATQKRTVDQLSATDLLDRRKAIRSEILELVDSRLNKDAEERRDFTHMQMLLGKAREEVRVLTERVTKAEQLANTEQVDAKPDKVIEAGDPAALQFPQMSIDVNEWEVPGAEDLTEFSENSVLSSTSTIDHSADFDYLFGDAGDEATPGEA